MITFLCYLWGGQETQLSILLSTTHPSIRLSIQVILSVQLSCSVVSNSLWPHELQHTRPPCLSPTAGVKPSYLVGFMDGGAWWAAVYGVTQSRTQLKWLSSSMQVPEPKKMNRTRFKTQHSDHPVWGIWSKAKIRPVFRMCIKFF